MAHSSAFYAARVGTLTSDRAVGDGLRYNLDHVGPRPQILVGKEPRFLLAPGGILALSVFGLRIYGVYRSAKNTPKRSPKVRRIERIVAISLWSFIAVGVTLLLVFKR